MKQAHVIVLVTTAKRANAQTVLRHHELEEYFDYVVTSDDVSASKPDPECYLLALQKCGIKPNEALAFEDSEPGILAAEAAGINVIRVGDFSDDIT